MKLKVMIATTVMMTLLAVTGCDSTETVTEEVVQTDTEEVAQDEPEEEEEVATSTLTVEEIRQHTSVALDEYLNEAGRPVSRIEIASMVVTDPAVGEVRSADIVTLTYLEGDTDNLYIDTQYDTIVALESEQPPKSILDKYSLVGDSENGYKTEGGEISSEPDGFDFNVLSLGLISVSELQELLPDVVMNEEESYPVYVKNTSLVSGTDPLITYTITYPTETSTGLLASMSNLADTLTVSCLMDYPTIEANSVDGIYVDENGREWEVLMVNEYAEGEYTTVLSTSIGKEE